jgi:spermidine/putrescine transport system substrate-binding protein
MNDERNRPPDQRIARRRFLQATALAGVGAFLAACGAQGASESASAGAATSAPGATTAASGSTSPSAAGGKIGGVLNFANWIGYIDVSEDGSSYPSLDEFKKQTGISVNYNEAISDNEEFFNSDLQPPLSQNLATAWDLIVVTDWMVARLVRLGWLEAIDLTATPNFPANLLPQYHGRSFDPGTKFAAPWQSGMTGIGFDRKKTGDVTSLAALWDAKYKGRITYLADNMRDTVGLTAIKLGFDPATITRAQFDESLAEIDKAVKGKLVRQLAGNSYVDAMASGDAIVAMAFSADVLTLLVPDQKPDQDFRFAVAREGGMLWTDNMCMPKGVKNKNQAQAFINFYYNPRIAAQVEAYVNFVCPVKGAAEVLKATNPDVANNPLIFPPADVVARLHQFRALDANEEKDWNQAFSKVLSP